MIVLKIIGLFVVAAILIVVTLTSVAIIRHLWILHSRRCGSCRHTMKCCGMCEHDGINQYMFECPKCGALEYVPVIETIDSNEAHEHFRG